MAPFGNQTHHLPRDRTYDWRFWNLTVPAMQNVGNISGIQKWNVQERWIRVFQALRYLQWKISLSIEFWCWRYLGISRTFSNRFRTTAFSSFCFLPEIENEIAFIGKFQKRPNEKGPHQSNYAKCSIWGFHANKVQKQKPNMVTLSFKIMFPYQFQLPFLLGIFICKSQLSHCSPGLITRTYKT